MRSACKHCGKHFYHERAGAQYCSTAHRVAALRQRQQPFPRVHWLGPVQSFSTRVTREGELSNDELADRLLEIADRDDDGAPKTARRFYYLALSHGHIRPDMGASEAAKKERDAAYKRVLDVLGRLRMQGRLGWDMVLDLTRELIEWQTYASPREARADMRQSYSEDRWIGQPYYPVLIVEKDTLDPICRPMARRWQMPFASSRGYGSLTLQHDIALMLRRRRQQHPKQWPFVFFISDLDPSGLDLERRWQEVLSEFGVVVQWRRLALTLEQVRTPQLDIERLSIDVKESDSRSRGYVEQYCRWFPDFETDPTTGEPIGRCWEADILPASAIEQALDFYIHQRLDTRLWKRREREIERARELL
jgi:hypothetical protein